MADRLLETKFRIPKRRLSLVERPRHAVGLQGLHGKAQAPVWYRNIRIKELK